MRKIIISTIFVLALACCACAQDTSANVTGVVTNVQFQKLVKNGTEYHLEPFETLYLGENNLGRLEFSVRMNALDSGNYVLSQSSSGNVTLIEALRIDVKKSGDVEYVELMLTVRPQELPAPLEVLDDPSLEERIAALMGSS